MFVFIYTLYVAELAGYVGDWRSAVKEKVVISCLVLGLDCVGRQGIRCLFPKASACALRGEDVMLMACPW